MSRRSSGIGRSWVAAIVVSSWLANLGLAAPPALPPNKPLKMAGEVKQVASGGALLLVTSPTGDRWKILVQKPAKPEDISYTGTAEASWLHPGVPIRFTGKFNKKGQGQDPIAELLIYNGGDFSIQDEAAFGTGFGDDPKKKAPKAPIDPNAIETLNVQGPIKTIKGNKVTLSVGRQTLNFELAENVAIKIDVNHFEYLQEGDSISIESGKDFGQFQGWADKAKVISQKPLVGKSKTLVKPGLDPKATDTTKKPDPKAGAEKEKPAEKPDPAKPAEKDKPADKADAAKPDAAKPADKEKAADAK